MLKTSPTSHKPFPVKWFNHLCSRAASGRILALFYGVYLLIAGSVCLILTPPFQVPDEANHFLRAVQIEQGDIFVHRQSNSAAGSYLPEAIAGMSSNFNSLPFHRSVKVTPEDFYGAFKVKWDSPTTFVNLWNVDIYSPTSYVGSSLAILISRHLNIMPLATFYLARLGNLVVNGAIGILALLLAEEAGAFILLFLVLPMSISLTASCSQDGMMVALSALVSACLIQFSKHATKWSLWLTITAALGIGFMAAGKAPYLFFLPLIWLFYSRQNLNRIVLITFISTGIFLFWLFFGLRPAAIPVSSILPNVSQSGQVSFLLHHIPRSIWQFTIGTLLGFPNGRGIVGVLGWDGAKFSSLYYTTSYILVVFILAHAFVAKKTNLLSKQFLIKFFLYLCILFMVYDLIFLALYLTWTPVGLNHVEGVQGRYMLPLFMMLAALPTLSFDCHRHSPAFSISFGVEKLALLAFMIYSTCSLYQVLSLCYW